MLVLLVIFMVTAPLLTVGVPLELPRTKAKQLSTTKEPLTISVDKAGGIYLQETKITLDDIAPKLKAITRDGYAEPIFIRGDSTIDYGVIMRVMGAISAAGYKKVSLITDLEGS